MATFSGTTGASADDAYETDAGDTDTNDTTILIDGVDELAGIRIPSVTIPQGSTVTEAYLDLEFIDSANDEPNVTIYGDDTDNSAQFSDGTGNNDISGRTPTTATVLWDSADIGATGTGYSASPDIGTIVQEIVNRGGWSSGNAMGIILISLGSGTRDCGFNSHDNATSNKPRLRVTYTAPAGSGGGAYYYANA